MITVAVRPSDGHVTNRINRSSIVWMFLGTNWVLSLRTFLEVTCKKGNLKYHREFSPGRWIIHVPQDVYLGVPPNRGGCPACSLVPVGGRGDSAKNAGVGFTRFLVDSGQMRRLEPQGQREEFIFTGHLHPFPPLIISSVRLIVLMPSVDV